MYIYTYTCTRQPWNSPSKQLRHWGWSLHVGLVLSQMDAVVLAVYVSLSISWLLRCSGCDLWPTFLPTCAHLWKCFMSLGWSVRRHVCWGGSGFGGGGGGVITSFPRLNVLRYIATSNIGKKRQMDQQVHRNVSGNLCGTSGRSGKPNKRWLSAFGPLWKTQIVLVYAMNINGSPFSLAFAGVLHPHFNDYVRTRHVTKSTTLPRNLLLPSLNNNTFC